MSKKSRKKTKKGNSWIDPLILGLLVIGAFLLRTVGQWNQVFVQGFVLFRGVDPWYHMRLVENMIANFPVPLRWDPLILYPEGMAVGYFPLMSWMIAIPGRIFNYEVVGALLPPILGALVLIPVYFICKKLWKGWVGLVACGLVAILPSEFLHRSLLGFTDHHVLEVLFSTLTMMFLVFMQKEDRLRWAVLAGLSLGLYMSSWIGGLLLVVPLWIWFFVTFILKLRKGEDTNIFCHRIGIVFGIGLLFFVPNVFLVDNIRPYLAAMAIVTISPYLLTWLSKRLSWKVLAVTVPCLIVVALVIADHLLPDFMVTVKATFYSPNATIQEVAPSSLRIMMANYGLSLLLFLAGLVLAIRRRENLLITIWCVFMLVFMLGQRRWGYYFTVNSAIMAAYLLYLQYGWFHKQVRVGGVVVACALLASTLLPSAVAMSKMPNVITPSWYNACVWLRLNTPEVGGYYELNPDEPDYGVLSWWDYGNWIARISRRAPISNPMAQTPSTQWEVLLAKDEEEANTFLVGINYIILDEATVNYKLYAIVHLSPYTDISWEPFINLLWNGNTISWTEIHREGNVRIYGRSQI